MTRDPAWQAEGAEVARSMAEALALANAPHIAVIGGSEIYALALPYAARVELTEIHADYPGDARMPPLGDGWREEFREDRRAEAGQPGFAWTTLKRDL